MVHTLESLLEFERTGYFNCDSYLDFKSSVWTALYYTLPNEQGLCSCFHVQWGDNTGPEMTHATAMALAKAKMKADPNLRFLASVKPQTAKQLRY